MQKEYANIYSSSKLFIVFPSGSKEYCLLILSIHSKMNLKRRWKRFYLWMKKNKVRLHNLNKSKIKAVICLEFKNHKFSYSKPHRMSAQWINLPNPVCCPSDNPSHLFLMSLTPDSDENLLIFEQRSDSQSIQFDFISCPINPSKWVRKMGITLQLLLLQKKTS